MKTSLKSQKILIVLISILMFTSCKEEEKTVESVTGNAVEIITNSNVLSYSIKYYGEGTLKEKYPSITTCQIKLVIIPGDSTGYFEKAQIEIKPEKETKTEIVINDGIIYKLDDNNKQLLRAPSYRIQAELYDPTCLAIMSLLPEINGSSKKGAKLIGEEKIEGVMCDIVEYQSETLLYKWWFGEKDHYLYRIKATSEHFGDGALIMEMSNYKTGKKINENDYTINLPEGYTLEEFTGDYPKIGVSASNWTVTTYNGEEISLESLKDKVVVLDFWATWCRPCVLSIPEMQKLHEKYRNNNVFVLGLTVWESGDPVKFMQSKNVTYPIAKGDEIASMYKVKGLPFVIVIGADGKIVDLFNGYNGKETDELLEKTIVSAL